MISSRSRKQSNDLTRGAYTTHPASDERLWVWTRGEATLVALNLSDDDATVDDVDGRVLMATDPTRNGESVEGALALDPWSAVILER